MANINIEDFYKNFPTIGTKRNRFPYEKEINFNMDMGKITPICAIRVVPGQTYNLNLSTVIKVAPLVTPPMDSAVFKAFAFYNQDRNTWKNYKYWFGEKQNPEDPENEPTYLVPKVTLPKGGFQYDSFYDNIGCPPNVGNYKIDAFLPRTDRQIYNTYFRNQSLENSLKVNLEDADDDPNENMELRRICKPRDFFTQCLPTQSGAESVEIPLGSSAPIVGVNVSAPNNGQIWFARTPGGPGERIYQATDTNAHLRLNGSNGANGLYVPGDGTIGMQADLSKAIGAPLEGLYQAIAYNTMQYTLSRGGNRYFEHLANIYGVSNPDAVIQQPEFLGSLIQNIDFDTVTQTTEQSGEATGLGHRAANGYMENYGNIINKSFGEFGWIIIYGVVTYYPKYQQGVSKLMDTTDPLELFNPIFNLMGDEAIMMKEIYCQDDRVVDEDGNPQNEEVWGYGKRNSRLLYPVNEIHGKQRSSYSQSLDTNHFAQYLKTKPALNKEFDKVTDEGFKRCLQYTDETQFICNALITGVQDIEIPMQAIPSPIPTQILPN